MFEHQLDLFYKEESHPDWVLIRENMQEIKLNDDDVIIKSYETCASAISIMMAGISKSENKDDFIGKTNVIYAHNGFYFLASNKKKL